MFHRKIKKEAYNKDEQKPVIRSSICTEPRTRPVAAMY